jgi:phosphoribosyl 1,2-cyclic phosphodiesterase
VKVTIRGSRGSIASAGPDTIRYGGNTACVQVEGAPADPVLVLDAGSGIRQAGLALAGDGRAVHVLLTHLHMDHIQGLGFFRPLFETRREVHIWGPPSSTLDLRTRLSRYLSPPLFPVRIRDLDSRLEFHDAPATPWRIGGFEVHAATVIHPGPTLGYRIDHDGRSLAYLPDHEPALGGLDGRPEWTSGHDLAMDVELLIHDAQYSAEEYPRRVGWGHSSVDDTVRLADLARARELILFHHEPEHDDAAIDQLLATARTLRATGTVHAAREGTTFEL